MIRTRDPGSGEVVGIDHVALPLRDAAAMVAFYRSIGLRVEEDPFLVRVRIGRQMINFHRPELWQGDFSLRAPAALPPCGDLCLVWEGPLEALCRRLTEVGVPIEEGPVRRDGGRGTEGTSIYVRDPDGNLVELMAYERETKEHRDVR